MPPDELGPAAPKYVEVQGSPAQGAPEAPLTLVEFSDFQCPYCAAFAANTLPLLEREQVHTGVLRVVYRDLPREDRHPRALPAALAAHCAGDQGRFWPMHNLLFASTSRLEPDDLLRHAQTLGLDEVLFGRCLDTAEHDADVRRDLKAGVSLGIQVTPTFYLGYTPAAGEPMEVKVTIAGAQPYSLFRFAIEDLLKRRAATGSAP